LPLTFSIVASRKARNSERIGVAFAARREALGRRFALDVGFDRKQPRDHFQRLRRCRRFRFDMDVEILRRTRAPQAISVSGAGAPVRGSAS
jgi:hypothetical protein